MEQYTPVCPTPAGTRPPVQSADIRAFIEFLLVLPKPELPAGGEAGASGGSNPNHRLRHP